MLNKTENLQKILKLGIKRSLYSICIDINNLKSILFDSDRNL